MEKRIILALIILVSILSLSGYLIACQATKPDKQPDIDTELEKQKMYDRGVADAEKRIELQSMDIDDYINLLDVDGEFVGTRDGIVKDLTRTIIKLFVDWLGEESRSGNFKVYGFDNQGSYSAVTNPD